MTGLSANDALTLVQIRAMLDLARRVAGSSAPVSRQTALVLLHAVNERVTHFAAHSLPQVQVGQKDLFRTLHDKVREALGERWAANDGWADVQLLQRARNAAQHEGLGADPALLPGWVTATELYTRTLVAALLSVALDEVYLAEAITDPVQADHLRRAEQALDIDDVPGALAATRAAFDSASRRWVHSFRDAHGRSGVGTKRFPGFDDLTSLAESIDHLESAVAAMAFAVDPAEVTWFESLRRISPEDVSSEQARRALSFVFWWIIRWQDLQTASEVETARRQAKSAEERVARTRDHGDARVYVSSVAVIPGRAAMTSKRVLVALELYDLPQPADLPYWTTSTEEINRPLPGASKFRLNENGTRLIADIDPDDDTDTLMQRAEAMLLEAETRTATKRAHREEQQRADDTTSGTFGEHLTANPLPPWIRSARLCRSDEVHPWMGNSRLRVRLDTPASLEDRVVAILAEHPSIENIRSEGHEYVITPELTAAQLSEAAHATTAAAEQAILDAFTKKAAAAQALSDLNNRLTMSLNRIQANRNPKDQTEERSLTATEPRVVRPDQNS